MFDPEFYPTPPEVAQRMIAQLQTQADDDVDENSILPGQRHSLRKIYLADMLILDPSAGSGALLDAVSEHLWGEWRPRWRLGKLHAVELNPDLQSVLRGKDYKVVGTDFLRFQPNLQYDAILMNPPFSNGDEHLLHAWDILHSGQIVCLLNATTITNPHSARRRKLQALIEQHGSVEMLGPVFAKAERPTDVEVAMVTLTKHTANPDFDFLDGLDTEREAEPEIDLEGESVNTPAVNDLVKVFTDQFRKVQHEFTHYQRARARFLKVSGYFMNASVLKDVNDICSNGDARHQHNAFTDLLQHHAWDLVFARTKIYDLMSSKARDRFDKNKKEQGAMAFTEENIHALFEMLFLNRRQILMQCLMDAFDQMTLYHRNNRMEEPGWASNDAHKVNRKVILPYAVEHTYGGKMEVRYGYRATIDDVDRGLAMLEGKRISQVRTVSRTLTDYFKDYQVNHGALADNTVQSEFFHIRFFKKGTLHLTFLDESLWRRFNMAVAQGKNWLPMDHDRQPGQDATDHAMHQLLLTA